MDPVYRRPGVSAKGPVARGIDKGNVVAQRLAVPSSSHIRSSGNEIGDSFGSLGRRGLLSSFIEMVGIDDIGWGGESGPTFIDPLQLGNTDGVVNELIEILEARRGCGVDPTINGNPKGNVVAVFGNVLMDERVGEPGQGGTSAAHHDLSFGPICNAIQDMARNFNGPTHALTPTRTLANLPGAAECPVCATCIG